MQSAYLYNRLARTAYGDINWFERKSKKVLLRAVGALDRSYRFLTSNDIWPFKPGNLNERLVDVYGQSNVRLFEMIGRDQGTYDYPLPQPVVVKKNILNKTQRELARSFG